jgi:hypothetical protein
LHLDYLDQSVTSRPDLSPPRTPLSCELITPISPFSSIGGSPITIPFVIPTRTRGFRGAVDLVPVPAFPIPSLQSELVFQLLRVHDDFSVFVDAAPTNRGKVIIRNRMTQLEFPVVQNG